MVEILKYNDDDLKDNEIDQVVTRVRAFILSSKNNFLITKTDEDGYQLFGTYVDENEDLENALSKAIYNETGIQFDEKDKIEPFFEIRHYNRDYKGSGINRMSDLIYFFIKSDKLPNYKKLKLTKEEIAMRTPVESIPKYNFVRKLKEFQDAEEDPIRKIKTKEILIAYDKLKEMYNL
ncbi:MAG: NUDIX hydrolase [Clostridiales bacterium]|nr:NUDIX hydrolase [Clostridiales bacterium]